MAQASSAKKILLVDDMLEVKLALLRIFPSGWRVVSAHSFEEGLRRFSSGSFDLVFLDVNMVRRGEKYFEDLSPDERAALGYGQQGYELADWILRQKPGQKIVMFSDDWGLEEFCRQRNLAFTVKDLGKLEETAGRAVEQAEKVLQEK